MGHYRLYFMNSISGHIDCARDVEACDDQAAIDAARREVKNKPIELWCGGRKVHRFEMPSPAAVERHRSHIATEEYELAQGVELTKQT